MLRNYLKIAFRIISKDRVFSLINIIGLSSGLAIALLIILYVRFEFSYEAYNPQADRLVRITMDYLNGETLIDQDAETYPPLGPRIKAAGQGLSPTGGHGDANGFRDDIFPHPHSGICDGVAECRKAVRTQIKYGADHIKYVATGGVLSQTATGTGQQFTDEEQIALVEAAHAMGRKVAAHAHGKSQIKSCFFLQF